ncbi:serine carboxypeptidase 1-like [Phragmites australis]|uniref:serine carboxypeptidase 1-like n=1 Tax=Phragmites australis TaxID=29695 RepID=UPI002D786C1C|nr:serine carboxypeptidase 1-like [Phragmites australis]
MPPQRTLPSVEAGAPMVAALLLCLCVLPVRAAPAGAEVTEFPGFSGELPSKHYAGYVTVGHVLQKRHMYYYFATSERDPTLDPIVIWINGGPACSGFSAFVHSIGPFTIEGSQVRVHDEPRVMKNPFSWTKMASLLLVDSPAGVGYSYADNEDDYVTNDSSRVVDLYSFLSKWFAEYTEFRSNPFYIAGCSYSGVIVPVLAQEILRRNEEGGVQINFKGYSLCNPAIDVDIENNALVPYAFRMGLISDELFQSLVTTCNGKYWNNTTPTCLENLNQFYMQIKGINVEHILCPPCRYKMGITKEVMEYDSGQMFERLSETSEYGLECHNRELALEKLFGTKLGGEKLHAKPIEVSGTWKRCPKFIRYTRDILTLTEYHLNITSKGYRVFLYSGDHALLVPFSATLEWLKKSNYNEIEKWHPWFVENQIAGYSIRYENNILFATIKGAGHVPSDYLPFEAFVAYQRWIDGAESL